MDTNQLLKQLNEAQREAVVYTDGAQLIVAGAGSGKTRVLTYKIAYLLQQGLPAESILALTFTNKAAQVMKDRIAALVGESVAKHLWMGTFHSICAHILRNECELLGYTHDYSIYDSEDSHRLVKTIVKDMQLDDKVYKHNVVLSRISTAKNNLFLPADYANDRELIMADQQARLDKVVDIYYEYERRLHASNAMDFDDLLLNMNRLLHTNEEARQRYQKIFTYILVDEYQDTNRSQCAIVKQLSGSNPHVCVVGDDAQSIYAFRGANIDNILGFTKMYEGAKVFKLERNYRSTRNIVDAANSLISKNVSQIKKDVYSEKIVGEPLHLKGYPSDREEARGIVGEIVGMHRRGVAYDDMAVLYRNNSQSRVLEDECRRVGVPYKIHGSTSFYSRKEIKDAIAYFRLVCNEQDDEALRRIINLPARGIGDTTVAHVAEVARNQKCALFPVVENPEAYQVKVSKSTASKLAKFAEMIRTFQMRLQDADAYELAENIIRTTGLQTALSSDTTPEGKERLENLNEFRSMLHEYREDALRNETEGRLPDFLAEIALLTDQDEHADDASPRVTLTTVHAAKGLEFDRTFIAGMEENLFPSPFVQTLRELEEERRLFYVAITRTMTECFISYSRSRFRNGRTDATNPSRFLKDLDKHYIDNQGEQGTMSFASSFFQSPIQAVEHQPSRMRPIGNMGKVENSELVAHRLVYPEGQRIRHHLFGQGKVVRLYIDDNGNERIVIAFDQAGTKELLFKFAKLETI